MFGNKLFCLILFPVLLTLGAGPSPDSGSFTFDFRQEGNRYFFHGLFEVKTDPQVAWEVLTDYDNLSRFVANMNCRILSREEGEWMVDQTVGGGFLFIRQEVKGLLRVRVKPYETIWVEEITRRQFGLYEGTWSIESCPPEGVLKVGYSLQVERNGATPGFVTADLFRQSQEDLLIGMKREMDRREAKKDPAGLGRREPEKEKTAG
jgi:hypothetical protein